jgi:hypothetical protein
MAKLVLLGVLGNPPGGVGPNRQFGPLRNAQGEGKQDWPDDPWSEAGEAWSTRGRHHTRRISQIGGEA